MRMITAAGLAGLAVVGLSACHKAQGPSTSGQAAAPSAAAPAVSLNPSSLPQRKSGLWSQQISMQGAETHAMPASQVCIDAATDAKISMMGQQAGRKACQAYQISRNLDGSWTVSSSCDFGQAGKVVSHGTISGDFNTAYTVQIDSTTTGAAFAAANGEHKMTIAAAYVGPCPAGWSAGDMTVNGMRMNMLKGAMGAPQSAGG